MGQYGDFERKTVASVMFWGCVCFNGVGTLTSVDGNINTDKYIETLDQNLWPVIARNFGNDPWIFQEDNAPCHVSKAANKWKKDNDIETLSWPAQSPDLNIIENVWKKIKQAVEKSLSKIINKDDLKRVVFEEWAIMSPEYKQSLYESIPARIYAVRKAKGYISKF